jgi:uroporphyrinogen-III decarboxylase
MTKKEIVKRAVELHNPPRIPLFFVNEYQERSDIQRVSYGPAEDFSYTETDITEWGFKWDRLDNTMGQPKYHPITDWEKLKDYSPPDPYANGRFSHVLEFIEKNKDSYLIGDLGITGFTFTTFIRGFQEVLEDLYIERENILVLIDMVMHFENDIIKQFGKYPIDAISFADDWGSQRALFISPAMWRELFKPRLAEQFKLVHEQGMHVYYHSCGYIYDIISDLIEIGVDILNLNQPDLLGIENLAQDFGGRVCFNCPVDHQTVAINGSETDIRSYITKLYQHFAVFNGGYIGHIEEYSCVGMSRANFETIVSAFEALAS